MSYATQDDMEKRFGVEELVLLTDREGTGAFNPEVFALAQLDGDSEIDAYLRPQYVLPLVDVPTNLVRLACDVYRYYLYGNQVPEFAQKRYDQAVKMLTLISSGKLDLNPDHNAEPAPEPLVHFSTGVSHLAHKLRDF